MKNYTKLQTKYIEEIQSDVTIYRHNKTNARICTIENDDNNKVFSIAFRTPPINSCGLTHILEHSVLCGSKRYPVKDPFVELLKSSLNTFLNAFTFPDKTMYPCASQNDKDFKNLMSVYMDAVFYPQIYQHEEIFMQEGWHYHILDEKDDITYNGVVYNEMKGAFSDPEQILVRNLMHSLYPDTAYGFESGGDPKYIPDLSYEEFLNFHKKFYHPSNSYIFLYGNCDMEERMNWLDEAYLSDFDRIDFDTSIQPQKPFDRPLYQTEYYPVAKEDSLEDKTFLSYNLVFPTTLDTKLMIAVSVLVSALFENPGAPLKQALIDAKLGQDVQTMFDDGLLQPLLSIMVMNSNPQREEEFIRLVDDKLKEIVREGLDKETLRSLLNFAEFKARERSFSSRMPQGLDIEMTCLNSWLYSEDQPFNKLEVLTYYRQLREELDSGYFENIIETYFLRNTHKSYVKLIPSATVSEKSQQALKERLAAYKASLSAAELKALIEKNKALAAYQSAESTPEEINTLPKLKLEDITGEPEVLNCQRLAGKYPVLFSEYHTNDIAYVNYYFDISHLDAETLQNAALFADLFTYLSAGSMSYKDIHQFILENTGGLKASVASCINQNKECITLLRIQYSALTDKVEAVNRFIMDLLQNTRYTEEKRLYERLCEIKLANEMGVSSRGHTYALMRAGSYCDAYCYTADLTSGIAYLDFISELVRNFETKKQMIIADLAAVSKTLFAKNTFTLGFAGTKEQLQSVEKSADAFYEALPDACHREKTDFVGNQRNEGIKTQYDVNFVARAGRFTAPYSGAMLVLSNAISLNYLWMQVRVHGGAYGCMMQIKPNGFIGFTSYRDPAVAKTNQVYEDVVKWIKELNPTEDELLKFKIGAIGNLDTVMHVSEKAYTAQLQAFSGLTYEIRKKYRSEVIHATAAELRSFAGCFKEALAENNLCVIGNAGRIEENTKLFTDVRALTK